MTILNVCLAFSVFVAMSSYVESSEVVNIQEIGAHQPILIVEKNVNPQNKMVVYTKVDANGRIVADGDLPLLDFYWLMDGKNYKPVNIKINKEIRERFTAQWSSKDRTGHIMLNMNDLKEMKSDLKETMMEVYAKKTRNGMSVEAQMNLGPSDENMRIMLSGIYTEGRAFPPSVESITLKGEKVVKGEATGKMVSRKYESAAR